MKKKILSILIVLALILALLPTFAAAIDDEIDEPMPAGILFINGYPVCSEADLSEYPGVTVAPGGNIRYDAETNTLYLKNVTIAPPEEEVAILRGEETRCFGGDATLYYMAFSSDIIAEREVETRDIAYLGSSEPLTIVSEGTNVIKSGDEYHMAICGTKLIFELKAGSKLTADARTDGVRSWSAAISSEAGDYFSPYGLRSEADDEGDEFISMFNSVVVKGPGSLEAIGGAAWCSSAGIAAVAVVVEGANVTATGGEIGEYGSAFRSRSMDEILTPWGDSVGIFGEEFIVIVEGSSVNATASDSDNEESIALYSENSVYIMDSVVNAVAGEGYYWSCGICADEELIIAGASSVTAEGDIAVYGEYDLEIDPALAIIEPEGGYVAYIGEYAEFDKYDDDYDYDDYDYGFWTVVDPNARPVLAEPRAIDEAIYEDDYDEVLVPATYVVIDTVEIARGYWVKIAETANGTVTSSLPGGGEGLEITLTATPDQGATLYEIKALDDAGRPVELIDAGEGVYTLVMPASDVRVRARFIKDLPFNDVDPDDYFYDAVVYLYENGITNGTSEDTYEPEKICTRAETVTFLWRTLGEPEPTTTTCKFTDVSPDAYYYKAVLWAAENGVTLGTSETTFSPDDNVLRCMTEAFLYRTIQLQGGGFTGTWAFQLQAPDAADVPDWAYESTCWMVMNQIVQGDEAGNILPLAECNRGQIAAMIYRTVV
ncbi:MAG: S-layer homology domain-containing protein [Oscillospiraceae bacterium]|nr:S-layer homology domain-containing protein [Oscillospiraceae bacterium]